MIDWAEHTDAETTSLRRRQFLTGTAAASFGLSAGCLGRIGADPPVEAQLGWVAVKNYHPDPHRVEVEIRREDAVIHRSSHALPGKPESRIPGAVLACTWRAEPAQYTLHGRVDGGEWVDRSVPKAIEASAGMDADTACVIAEGAYGRYGSHEFGWRIQDWCGEVADYDGGCEFANSTA